MKKIKRDKKENVMGIIQKGTEKIQKTNKKFNPDISRNEQR